MLYAMVEKYYDILLWVWLISGFGIIITHLIFILIRVKEKKRKKLRKIRKKNRNLTILVGMMLLMASCSGSKHAGQYLVSIRAEKDTIQYVDSRMQVDSIITRALDGDLMGKKKPYFEIKNSEVFIYVEKKK